MVSLCFKLNVLFYIDFLLAVPMCFALTSNKKHETYEAIFRCLQRMGLSMKIDFKPTTIVCDFEQAFINAIEKEVNASLLIRLCQMVFCLSRIFVIQLPQTCVTGCWFHFCQSCYRSIHKLGLMSCYNDDVESRELLRSFMPLALLPTDCIRDGYDLLKRKSFAANHKEQLAPFVFRFRE